jgi:hypothetical protein
MPDFTTDGCTSFPDMWWQACCVLHDYAYWWQPTGTTRAQWDGAMASCMSELGAGTAAAIASVGLFAFGGIVWNRGRRGTPGTEPPMLKRWAERLRAKDQSHG